MRRFGRQCRGQGKVLLRLVRETEARLLDSGQPIMALAQVAQAGLQSAMHLGESRRQRLVTALSEALSAQTTLPANHVGSSMANGCGNAKLSTPTIRPLPPFSRARVIVQPSLAASPG